MKIKNNLVALVTLPLLFTVGVLLITTESGNEDGWSVYELDTPDYSLMVEYPANWTAPEINEVDSFSQDETGLSIGFLPPDAASSEESINININDDRRDTHRMRPPLTPGARSLTLYGDLIRKVEYDGRMIPVKKRGRDEDTSKKYYYTAFKERTLTVEVRFGHRLDRKYDAVFDHMVNTLDVQYKER